MTEQASANQEPTAAAEDPTTCPACGSNPIEGHLLTKRRGDWRGTRQACCASCAVGLAFEAGTNSVFVSSVEWLPLAELVEVLSVRPIAGKFEGRELLFENPSTGLREYFRDVGGTCFAEFVTMKRAEFEAIPPAGGAWAARCREVTS